MDEQGNILDTFYDSVLFCPSNSFPFTGNVKANADLYRADMFTEGFNLYAWDEAARQVQEAIPGTADATVWLNLMCPDNDDTCPDVDGDGKVSYNDALMVLRLSIGLVELNEEESAFGDVDGANGLSYNDALKILRASIGMDTLE